MENSYTVTHNRSFNVDGCEIAAVIDKFVIDWQENPLGMLPLIKGIYLEGVKSGLLKAGFAVKGYTEEAKNKPCGHNTENTEATR